jgi:hypothetical protein
MAKTIKPRTIAFRATTELANAVRLAAASAGVKPADYARQALAAHVAKDRATA